MRAFILMTMFCIPMRRSILKRVIQPQASGSAWYFNRFLNLAVKILDGEAELIN